MQWRLVNLVQLIIVITVRIFLRITATVNLNQLYNLLGRRNLFLIMSKFISADESDYSTILIYGMNTGSTLT